MVLTLAAMAALAHACAPTVAPETLVSVARVESGFDPLTIGVNGAARRTLHPANARAAAAEARRLIAAGENIDLGLGQINSRNLGRLGLAVAAAFDPCRNLAASARVLEAGYRRGETLSGDAQAALGAAFSVYNTGDARRGYRNGYVRRVAEAAVYVVPAIRALPAGLAAASAPPVAEAARPVFAEARAASVIVF